MEQPQIHAHRAQVMSALTFLIGNLIRRTLLLPPMEEVREYPERDVFVLYFDLEEQAKRVRSLIVKFVTGLDCVEVTTALNRENQLVPAVVCFVRR